MNLTWILLTAAICAVGVRGVSQTITYTATNASVEDIISVVKQQTKYVFLYNKKAIRNAKKINITAKNLPINDFLSLAFKDQPFTWSVENQTIILERASPQIADIVVIREVLPIQVLDVAGKPLAGATVTIKTSGRTAFTNAEGRAAIQAETGDVLFISFIGYESKEVKIADKKALFVHLILKETVLNDIVVVGYGTQRRGDVTGALSRITAETITERPVVNTAQALQGKVSGLNVTTNIKPGETPTIRIRGTRSRNASNEPLYVVDGIPIVSALAITSFSINDLNPNDIASIEILKDASATAIYGSRGANGVILITTKRATKGKTTVNFISRVSLDSYKSMIDWMDAGQYIDQLRYGLINGRKYQPGNPSDLNVAPAPWYPDPHLDSISFATSGITNNYSELLDAAMKGYEWNSDGSVTMRPTTTAEQALGWPARVPVYNSRNIPTFDWRKAVTRTGVTQNHQVSISSGTEAARLYMSLGYNKQLGVQKDQDFERFTINLNGDISATKWFSLGISMIGSLAKQNFGTNDNLSNTGAKDLFGRAAGQFPWAFPTDGSGEYIRNAGGNLNSWNPLIDIDQSLNERRNSSALANIYTELKFTPWLRYRSNFGVQIRNFRKGSWTGPEVTNHLNGKANTAGYERDEHFSYVLENLLYVDKTFARVHRLGITLLQSQQQSRRESITTGAGGLVTPVSLWYDLASNTQGNPSYGTGFTENTLTSFMGRVNYALKNKYLLTASGRFDGSSVLAPKHKWDFFPSFALAWKMQEENFISTIDWINELKPRVGYGVTGNSSVAPYTTTGPLSRNNYVFGTVASIGFLPGSVQNPDLRWEKTAQLNLGVDYSVLNDRIAGSIEFYIQKTSDLLFTRSLPAVSGYVTKVMNIGASRNRGIEVTLNTDNIRSRNFSWSTELNWSTNKEEIVELINGKQDMIGSKLFIGQPWQVFYQLQNDGIWGNSDKELQEMAKFKSIGGLDFTPGTVKVVDQNGDYKIGAEDYVVRGTPRPKWYGGITNTFRYKGLSLSSFIYARIGQTYFGGYPYIFNRNENDLWNWNTQRGRWPLPVLGVTGITNIESAMQYYDGSFAIVRNISLSYDVPVALLGRYKIKNLQLNIQVLNPFIFGGEVVKMGINPDDETNWDSESQPNSFHTNPGGGMNNNTILPRSIVFGLRAAL